MDNFKKKMLWIRNSLLFLTSFSFAVCSVSVTLPNQYPFADNIAQDVQRRVNISITKKQMVSTTINDKSQCLTGNPIDDCWRCHQNRADDRQGLADCAIGFGRGTLGGKGGEIYVVTDPSDQDIKNPKPGTLRFAVIKDEPFWIIFARDMVIKLRHELIVNNRKTIDDREKNVVITGYGCIMLQYVKDIIIHNVHIYNCKPPRSTEIKASPSHAGWRGRSDSGGISIYNSDNIWIDHCTDCLIDAVMGSTAITISNSYFSHQDKVMLLGDDDKYFPDRELQATIAFNHFGQRLGPQIVCRGQVCIHVVNNDFMGREMYVIDRSPRSTINSHGNRYSALPDANAKEVTKHVDTEEGGWSGRNCTTDGDVMEGGKFCVALGKTEHAKASSIEPRSDTDVEQLKKNAGALTFPRNQEGTLKPSKKPPRKLKKKQNQTKKPRT